MLDFLELDFFNLHLLHLLVCSGLMFLQLLCELLSLLLEHLYVLLKLTVYTHVLLELQIIQIQIFIHFSVILLGN